MRDNNLISSFHVARTWARDSAVPHPMGWLAPIVLAAICFFGIGSLAAFIGPDVGAVLPMYIVTGGFVFGLYEALYVGLWRGQLPWSRPGAAILLALLWTVSLALLGASIFAPVTFVLYHHEWVSVASGVSQPPLFAAWMLTSWQFATEYFWQVCHVIPLLEVTDTVGWKQPLKYGTALGLLLLLFKILVVIPLVASLRGVWAGRTTAQSPQPPEQGP